MTGREAHQLKLYTWELITLKSCLQQTFRELICTGEYSVRRMLYSAEVHGRDKDFTHFRK